MRIAGMPFDYSTHPAAMPRWKHSLRVAAYRGMHPVRSWRARAIEVTWHPLSGPEGGTYEVRRNGRLMWRGVVAEPDRGVTVWHSHGLGVD